MNTSYVAIITLGAPTSGREQKMNFSYHRCTVLPAADHKRCTGVKTRRQPAFHTARIGYTGISRRGLPRIIYVLSYGSTCSPKTATCMTMHTLAPSLAKTIAVAFPIPDDAPVTSAAFPSNLPPMINFRVVFCC